MSTDALPEDSVLRRHALTERRRVLGQPPTDSVLKRHFAQLEQAEAARPSATLAPRQQSVPSGPPRTLPSAATAARPAASSAAPAPSGGGLFGWLKRLLGS